MNKRSLLILVCVALFALAGGAAYAHVNAHNDTPASGTAAVNPKSVNYYVATAGKPSTKTFDLKISNNKIASGPSTITVNLNDDVLMHLDGVAPQGEADIVIEAYNLQATTAQNSVPVFEFKAVKKGSFPILIRPEQEETESTEAAGESASDTRQSINIGTLIVK